MKTYLISILLFLTFQYGKAQETTFFTLPPQISNTVVDGEVKPAIIAKPTETVAIAAPDVLRKMAGIYHSSYTGSGALLKTEFVVTHNLGIIPSKVFIQPTSVVTSVSNWIDPTKITATTFTVVFGTALSAGTNNIKFDWVAIK